MNAPALLKTTPLREVRDVKSLLMNQHARDQLAMVAAKHMNPERMMRVVANAIRTTPKLQDCEPMSFLGALMHCASLGLEPNTPLGHAYLIPFENKRKNVVEVQVVIGYKGFIDLGRRSRQLAVIHPDVVYSDDELWSHEYGSNQHIRHRPGPRRGKLLGAYCYIKFNLGDGMTAEGHRFMTIDEIIDHRNQYSQGWKTAVRFNKQDESPWSEKNPAFASMAMKTVIRQMANRGEMPMSIEFINALETDEIKADYRTFAMNPEIGVTPEIEGAAIDTETGEVTAQIEDGRAGQQVANDAARQKPAPARAASEPVKQPDRQPKAAAPQTAAPSADQLLFDPKTGEVTAEKAAVDQPTEEEMERYTDLAGMIVAEIQSGAQPEEIDQMYGPQIEFIQARIPDLMVMINKAFMAKVQG